MISPPVLPNMSGALIDRGRVKLYHRIGSGGLGDIYRAIDTVLCDRGRPVAVKVIRKAKAGCSKDTTVLVDTSKVETPPVACVAVHFEFVRTALRQDAHIVDGDAISSIIPLS